MIVTYLKKLYSDLICVHNYRIDRITFDGLMDIECDKCHKYCHDVSDNSLCIVIAKSKFKIQKIYNTWRENYASNKKHNK